MASGHRLIERYNVVLHKKYVLYTQDQLEIN